MKRFQSLLNIVTIALAIVTGSIRAQAADVVWTNGAASGNWTNSLIWFDGAGNNIPDLSTENAILTNNVGAARVVTMDQTNNLTFGDLIVSNSAAAGNTITVDFNPLGASAAVTRYLASMNNVTLGSNAILKVSGVNIFGVTLVLTNAGNLSMTDNAQLITGVGAAGMKYVIGGLFANSANTLIQSGIAGRGLLQLTFTSSSAVITNNGTIENRYDATANYDNKTMPGIIGNSTNWFINAGTYIVGSKNAKYDVSTRTSSNQVQFVNTGTVIVTNYSDLTHAAAYTFKVTGMSNSAVTNAGTWKLVNGGVGTNGVSVQVDNGGFVNTGTFSSEFLSGAVGVSTNVLLLNDTTTGASVFSNAVGGQVIVVSSNFAIQATQNINLGTNFVSNAGTLIYQSRTAGNGFLDNGGVLKINGTLVVAGGLTNLSGGLIQGIGTVNAPTVVKTSSTVSPGNNSIDRLAFTGNLTLQGTYVADLQGSGDVGGHSNDLLDVSGVLTLTGATLSPTQSVNTTNGEAFVIAKYGTLVGTFANEGLPAGWTVDYNYQGGNQIAILIPEPSTLVLVGFGLAGAVVLARRRSQRR